MSNSQPNAEKKLDADRKERIAFEVIKVLCGRFGNFPDDASGNRNAPFHQAFLNAFSNKLGEHIKDVPFFISLSSWLQGLNTTMGQTFFEEVAHILSNGEKRVFTKDNKLTILVGERDAISDIMTNLKNSVSRPDMEEEDRKIAQVSTIKIAPELVAQVPELQEIDCQEFTADNYVEEDDFIEAIELKSVRPNSGELQGEKRKVLNAKAALRRKYKDKDVRFFFGFPFDPWSATQTGYDKNNFISELIEGAKYLDAKEVLLAGELWDRLSGIPETMQQILDIINVIATTDFMENYNFLSDPKNVDSDKEKYINLLSNWGIIRERILVENLDEIRLQCKKISGMNRVLNNKVFTNEGKYNNTRFEKLFGLLHKRVNGEETLAEG
jgi:hypothetical protein